MAQLSEILRVYDNHGFHYDVDLAHSPDYGFTTAYYNGSIVGQCELGKCSQPRSDDDREWEEWEERFSAWRDEVISNLKFKCQEFFNKNKA